MIVPYLVKTIKSNKLSDVVSCIDEPPIDMNLMLWDAEAEGQVKIDQAKDRIEILVDDIDPWYDADLANKIMRVIQHYAAAETTINRGRLDGQIKDPLTNAGYKRYQYLMTLQYLIDTDQIIEEVVSVPGIKGKRPPHKFVFLCLPENAEFNAEWNAKQVNRWIDETNKLAGKKRKK